VNTEKLTWYVARSGGIVAWCLLALSLALGLLLAGRMHGRKVGPAWILSVHRFLGGVSVLFTAVHVVAIMLDDFVDFGFVEALVPWTSTWKASPVAWGIIAMYLSIAIEATSFAMKRLPRKLWRAVHWSSAPLFGLATLHGYQSGTDAGRAFIIAIVVVMVALGLLTVARVVFARRRTEPKPDPRQMVADAKARRLARAAAAAAANKPVVAVPYDQEPVLVSANDAEPPRSDRHPNNTPANMDIDRAADRSPDTQDPVTTWASPGDPAEPTELGGWFGRNNAEVPAQASAHSSDDVQPRAIDAAATPDIERPPPPQPPAPQAPEPSIAVAASSDELAFGDLTRALPANGPPLQGATPTAAGSSPVKPQASEPLPPHAPPLPPAPTPTTALPRPPASPAERPPSRVTAPAAPASAPQPTPKPDPTPAEFASVGAAAIQPEPAPMPPPSPAWSLAASDLDGAVDWVTANPEGNPDIKRREGPVPGVWKRTRRNLSGYVDPTDSN
jgi:DMSO/TMAO reductase YedYZ heme-binding membrane subunit